MKQLIKAYTVLNLLDPGLFFSVSKEGIYNECNELIMAYQKGFDKLDYIKKGYDIAQGIWKK